MRRYHKVFWKRNSEIKDIERVLKNIEKGAERRNRLIEVRQLFVDKVKRSGRDPLNDMEIKYTANQKIFGDDEDRFLVLATYQHGYGEWELVRTP